MRFLLGFVGFLGLSFLGLSSVLLVGCEASSSDVSTEAAAETQAAPGGVVSTRVLVPEPIEISLGDLPEPYASESAGRPPNVVAIPDNASLKVPEGFVVNVFAEGLDSPRWLALTPAGEVLVTETRENRISLLADDDGDGIAERKETFATARNGLNIPFGMAFGEGAFFLGNTDEVLRFSFTEGQTALEGRGEQVMPLPGGGYNQHWTRNVVISPGGDSQGDGKAERLFVSVGSRSNVDEEALPRASVQTVGLDGSNPQTFASGLRNPVGMDFHPVTGELYVTVNERDGLGDNLVPDYFTRVQRGEFFGWPYAYLSPENLDPRQLRGGESTAPTQARATQTPDVLFQSHSAALGLQFYGGESFPERYQNGAFVAFRGSWNRREGTGYKVVFVPFDEAGRPTGAYEDFLTGFLIDPDGPTTWGRPVGLLVMPDGSLLLTEEANNRIYRIQYDGE